MATSMQTGLARTRAQGGLRAYRARQRSTASFRQIDRSFDRRAGPTEGAAPDAVAQHRNVSAAASASAAGGQADNDARPAGFGRTRLITFVSLWLGYACFYVTRTCFNYVNPLMLKDAALGVDLTAVGFISSLLPIAYAFSKGISGFLGSTMSPRLLLSGGLAATGLTCLGFGFGQGVTWFAAFWTLNGLLQGLGAPACAKLLTQWYSSSERGTAWAIWTASNNVGGFVAPWIAGGAAGALGWRYGMWLPAACALAIASVIVFTITDKPTDKGFPPAEGVKAKPAAAEKKGDDKGADEGPTVKEILMKDVLPNPYIWLFAISYFFVYLVRQGASTWFVHYLMNVKGVETLAVAAGQVSGLEVGGFFGALSAGTLSDVLVRKTKKNASDNSGLVGVRVRVVLGYGILTALALLAFSVCPNQPAIQWASIAAVGFGLYGPQMLIGLCGAEVVRPDAVGAAQGLLGWVSYMGAACAGAPLAFAVQKMGWSFYFSAMTAAAVAACVLVLPMLNLRSYTQGSDT